jgi:ATP-dependent DNA helicase DinG
MIRLNSDHGIVVILDNRIVTKPYGRAFMQALPKCPVEIV